MERLEKLLQKLLSYDFTFGLYDKNKIDIITELPLEISSMIMSMLDTRSLECAAMVSHRWRRISEYERKHRRRWMSNKSKKYMLRLKMEKRKFLALIRKSKDDQITDRIYYNRKQKIFNYNTLKRQKCISIRV